MSRKGRVGAGHLLVPDDVAIVDAGNTEARLTVPEH